MTTLRPYQQPVFDDFITHSRSQQGAEPVLAVVSVGGGKTALAAFISKHVSGKGGRVMLIARQGELVEQDANFATMIGVKVSLYSASLGAKQMRHETIMGTEGTIVRALDGNFAKWAPDLIIWDEAHQGDPDDADSMFRRIMDHFRLLNPKVRILGLTGSPFRGTDSIIGDFWSKAIGNITTEMLIDDGWLVQPDFGWPDHAEDSFDFTQLLDQYGEWGFREDHLDKLREGDPSKTERIMAEVVHRTHDMLGVLIFAQTKKHCREIAAALPEGSWCIITDDTPESERRDSLAKARSGEIKYTINVGVLTTGVDVPYWQVVVYLRPVGALVLLIQSIGRVLRLLVECGTDMNAASADVRKEAIAASRKPSALVLDYAGVFDRLGHLYDSPILEREQLQRSRRDGSIILCPACGCENSDKARRCIGIDHKGIRCDHFWVSKQCPECGTHNDVTARDCRECRHQLIDPNEALLHKPYSDEEMVPIKAMHMEPTKNGGIVVRYELESSLDHGDPEEFFMPGGSETARRVWYNKFLLPHCPAGWRSEVYMMKTAAGILKMKAAFDSPTHIAYRINEKGKAVVGRRRFRSGRTTDGQGKEVKK